MITIEEKDRFIAKRKKGKKKKKATTAMLGENCIQHSKRSSMAFLLYIFSPSLEEKVMDETGRTELRPAYMHMGGLAVVVRRMGQ